MFHKLLSSPLVLHLTIFLIFLVSVCECNEKQEPSIKNMTAMDKAKPKPKHNDDPFKKDLRKFLRECGADVSVEDDDDDDGPKNNGEHSAEEVAVPKGQRPKDGAPNAHWAYEKKRGGKGGTYPSQYGKKKGGGRRGGSEEDSEEDEDEDDYRGSSNRRKGGNNRRNNRKGNKKGRPSDDYDDSRGDNCDDDRKGGGYGSGGRKGFSSSQWGGGMGYNRGGGSSGGRYNTKNYGYTSGYSGSDPFGQKTEYGVIYTSSPDMWGSRTGYSTYGGRLMAMNTLRREKRQKNTEQCMSQCVFGYLEMLDNNRIPAETEVIKYFQNKIQNNTERMRLIKLARKCFAKLSTTEIAENEDGCQFSKDLARCLQIEIKGETY